MDEALLSAARDRQYEITITNTGVYLTVWPPRCGGPVSKTAIIEELNKLSCTDFDNAFIATVIREAIGKPILIMNSLQYINGRYQITTTDAGVYLTVWPPGSGGIPVAKAAVIEELVKRNFTDFDQTFIATVIREAIGQPILIINSLQYIDGRYQITATDAGVYLTVWPPGSGGNPVAKAQVMKDLREKHLTNFDEKFLSSIISEALATPILIVNPQPQIEVKPAIRIAISLDHLQARISIKVPKDAPPVTKAQLLDKLNTAGVIYGIDEQILETLVETQSAVNVICAQGIPPQSGKDAYLKYYVDPDSQGRPEELEDGRVDFKEIHNFLCVEEGQLLAEKVPAQPGEPGIDVFGMEIRALPGKDIRLPVGKNVITVDEWRLYSAIHGHLHIFLNKRINVIPVIIIEGDIDYSTGNIDFKGSVIVKGTVQPDFFVKAGGNVEVYGSICGGSVEATNILVHKGIQGMNRSVIKARKRLVANFIENATVYADQDIVVSDVILNSLICAGMRVIVEGKRGTVRGGRISAGEVIRVCTVGNQSGIVTELEVSVNPFFKDELLRLHQEIKKSESLYQELAITFAHFDYRTLEQFPAEKKDRYKKKAEEYQALSDRLEELRQRAASIEELLSAGKPGRIRVRDFIYPGAKIAIGALTKAINEPLQFISFYALGGEIKFTSLH